MPPKFRDRFEAGEQLGTRLSRLRKEKPLVLAIPRGGVQVGFQIARALGTELDVIAPRKIGAPGEPELAAGAVMHDGSVYLNQDIVDALNVGKAYLDEEKGRQRDEAVRRLRLYRGDREYPDVRERVIILVDDGIATGATVMAALRWLRENAAKQVIVACPVAPPETVARLREEADEVVCLSTPSPFHAIGQFYDNFEQVSDEEVVNLLDRDRVT